MIQIKETDLLWKFYKRWHTEDNTPPKNICRYFWHSVFGLLAYLFVDLPALAVSPLLLLSSFLAVGYSRENTLLLTLSAFFTGFSIVYTFIKVGLFIQERDKLKTVSTVSFVFTICLMLFAMICNEVTFGDRTFHLISFWHGFLTLISMAVLFFLISMSVIGTRYYMKNNEPSVNVVKSYLQAIKAKACPLVTSPYDSENEEEIVIHNEN